MLIRSGEWQQWPEAGDYVVGLIDDILIERLIWGPHAAQRLLGRQVVAAPGYIWYRFWLWRDEQVVEKYFDTQGQLIGTQIDVCAPLRAAHNEWSALDLLLDIWITPAGQVTVRGEAAFERAARDGALSAGEAEQAEQQVRRLTAAIAQGRFPPALVRNWQVDMRRIQEATPS